VRREAGLAAAQRPEAERTGDQGILRKS
jgi:hypothetical protein